MNFMGKSRFSRVLSLLLAIVIAVVSLPTAAFAEAVQNAAEEEVFYIKEVRLAQAETREEAKVVLEDDGFIFLDSNLNEGTGEDGIWLGYKVTSDPTEAIYDMKLMNTDGGFTLTSMEEAIKAQESAFAEMAYDLELLIDEFVEAYNATPELISAQKAYMALNFFRVVDDTDAPVEENGLGYQIVHGGVTTEILTEIIMFCDSAVLDSIVKILTMGIQLKNENWMEKLSKLGPYDEDKVYGLNDEGGIRLSEDEIERRADQLAIVLEFYIDAYNAFDDMGLVSGTFDDNFNIKDAQYKTPGDITADELAAKKADESRYKFYKVVFDELDKYSYGAGQTLKDFFRDGVSATDLYPLVSVLSDGEYAAMSYGCFLEVATGASAEEEDFAGYDNAYSEATNEVQSFYLYTGVDAALLSDDSVVGFTDSATRHMASTGEFEFYENDTFGEMAYEKGITAAKFIGMIGLSVMGVAKVTVGVTVLVGTIASSIAAKSTVYAGIVKIGSLIGGPWALLITASAVAITVLVSWLISVIDEAVNGTIDWDEEPMPEYLYDVRDITFLQKSENEGIATEYVKCPAFGFYEAVRDENGQVVDLNARSKDASQWIGLYVSYDKLGNDAKPIKADSFKVQMGNGEVPNGYIPLTRFAEVEAYDLNEGDGDDDVNGIYMFYQQDITAPPVESDKTFYISDVYLQSGESDTHCIALLRSKGYTVINTNLTPDYDGDDDRSFTYIGYKTTTDAGSALRDIRMAHGFNQAEIRMGDANYAESGSNGKTTLYTTKYESAGTPILAGGLICVNDRADAPDGYEPICLVSGGPAVSFNTLGDDGEVVTNTHQTYLYFLPETTFTSGPVYIGNVAFVGASSKAQSIAYEALSHYEIGEWQAFLSNFWKEYGGYDFHNGHVLFTNTVAYYPTHNPYRAIYSVKASAQEARPESFSYDNVGYTAWNEILWYTEYLDLTNNKPDAMYIRYNTNSEDLYGTLYLSGNPADNDYESGKMSKVQPLSLTDLLCFTGNDIPYSVIGINSTYTPVTDFLANETKPVDLSYSRTLTTYNFNFYVTETKDDLPYVTNIVVADKLTFYRNLGGKDEGVSRSHITDAMMYQHLAARGATNFCGHRVSMGQATSQKLHEMNALLFGYARGDSKKSALTDLFIQINDFSFDEPPKTVNRGNVVYTLLCEIPYNLTGYKDAPGPGVWLYGTTDKRAGNNIIDFEVSQTPFMNGYETVRTQNGRSPWLELHDMMERNEEQHFLGWAEELFEDLKDFFGIMDRSAFFNNYFEHAPYYFHIKREGDSITAQKPYIETLYLADYTEHKAAALEELFDAGAEEYINADLNKDAGGQHILLGYSRTESVEDAIKDIQAYHEDDPAKTRISNKGVEFTLVSDMDLNIGAGGDYIYLYTTKEGDAPIAYLDIDSESRSLGKVYTVRDKNGEDRDYYHWVAKKWNTNYYSNLNGGTNGENVYLFLTRACGIVKDGTYEEPSYGIDKLYTRDPGCEDAYLDPDGKYIAELYVMDKETLRKEKGRLYCQHISDQEVFDRLREMGATEIISTPISANSRDFGFWNGNKVYIGYSRTDRKNKAIRDIAIHVELISNAEPSENISINRIGYNLVAEAATEVKELPKAINLLGIGDGKQMAFPKMYLYESYSSSSLPLTDICIDLAPLLEGWNTVRSSNGIDAFIDVQNQAHEQYLLADKDDADSYDEELVYTDSLFEWMDDVSEIFDPVEENITIFYIHTKNYTQDTIEEEKPYIQEVYLASGETRHDALTQLVAFAPDGFIDIDLNRDADGNYVYLAYKRTAKASSALRDLMICEGKNPANTRRVEVHGIRIPYELVAGIDLNDEAGGDYLYLYASDSKNIGNPIKSIGVVEREVPTYYVRCGLEKNAVLLVEKDEETNIDRFTDECVDLNEGAGGDYLYMYMYRETTAGHRLVGNNRTVETEEATCGDDGYEFVTETCDLCKQEVEIETVYAATGKHVDTYGDGDHKCDICGDRNVTGCIRGEPEKEDIVFPYRDENGIGVAGSYTLVYRCVECGKVLSSVEGVEIPATPENIPVYAMARPASMFGEGSLLAICIFLAIGASAVIIIPIIRKRIIKQNTKEEK